MLIDVIIATYCVVLAILNVKNTLTAGALIYHQPIVNWRGRSRENMNGVFVM